MMKKIFNLALIAGAALSTSLTGCSKETSEEAGSKDEKTVMFQMQHVDGTRAVSTHVADQTAVTITKAYVYFVDGDLKITERVELVAGNGAYDSALKTVGMAAAEAVGGTAITSVPGSTRNVYIIGNYPGTWPVKGEFLNPLLTDATTLALASQYDSTNGGVGKVTLFGTTASGALTTVDASQNKYSASITVAPVAARMEIGSINAVAPATGDWVIKSFSIKGIYMNNYYPTMSLDGSAAAAIVFNGTDKAKYNGAAAGSSYIALSKILADYTAADIVAQATAMPSYAPKAAAVAATDVWAYNLLAPVATGTAMSHIVIHLTDVVLKDKNGVEADDAATYAGDQYLTIRNIFVDGATTPLAALAQGYVYRLNGGLNFTQHDLTPNPEMNTIDIQVSVEFLKWKAKEVDYDFK